MDIPLSSAAHSIKQIFRSLLQVAKEIEGVRFVLSAIKEPIRKYIAANGFTIDEESKCDYELFKTHMRLSEKHLQLCLKYAQLNIDNNNIIGIYFEDDDEPDDEPEPSQHSSSSE